MDLMKLASRAWAALRTGPANPQGTFFQRFGMTPIDGARVTHEDALMKAAVWACIDVVASAMASSDWNVYAGVRGAADKQALPADSLQSILNTRMNPDMTAQAGKRALMIAAVGYGNGYAEIEWDLAGRMVALWPIAPNRVDPRRVDGRMVYRVSQDYQGGVVDMDPSDIFHIRGASLVGFVGDDMIGKAIQTIGMNVALDQFGASYFSNGTQLGGVLKYTGKLDDPTYERLKNQFNARHQGTRNAFRTAILEGGMDFTMINSDAQKAQLIEAKYQIIEEICRWFRVPPHKIAHLLRATNNNIEHQGLEFSRDTMRPWQQEIQQEADWKFLPARGQRKFVEIDVDWASQGDFGSRMTAYSTGINGGVYCVNDVLRKLGENTIGPEGEVHMVQGAMMKLKDVGKNLTPPAPSPAPAPADDTQPAANALIDQIRRRSAGLKRDTLSETDQ